MNTIQTVPVIVYKEPETCPKCHKPEDIKEVCAHCGHEYEDEPVSTYDVFIAILVVLFAVWIFITLIVWLIDHDTLFDVVKNQYDWIKTKRIY